MATLAERLEEIKNREGLTYQGLADRINSSDYQEGAKITKSMIADIINAPLHPEKKVREPGYKTIIKIAKAFDVSIDYLLGVTDDSAAISEDINIASKTTGLDIDTIKSLVKLKSVSNLSDAERNKLNYALCEVIEETCAKWNPKKPAYTDEILERHYLSIRNHTFLAVFADFFQSLDLVKNNQIEISIKNASSKKKNDKVLYDSYLIVKYIEERMIGVLEEYAGDYLMNRDDILGTFTDKQKNTKDNK